MDRQISTAGMLYSLNRELTGRQETERERLLAQMERLYNNNMALNCRLYGIIRDFESETDRRLEERYMQFLWARDRSFYTVSTLAVFISLLTILLYIIIHRELNRRNRYRRQLEASNRENTELLQSRKCMMLTIAHDLRSPLPPSEQRQNCCPMKRKGPDRRNTLKISGMHRTICFLWLTR